LKRTRLHKEKRRRRKRVACRNWDFIVLRSGALKASLQVQALTLILVDFIPLHLPLPSCSFLFAILLSFEPAQHQITSIFIF
jgi:hypothetical protein